MRCAALDWTALHGLQGKTRRTALSALSCTVFAAALVGVSNGAAGAAARPSESPAESSGLAAPSLALSSAGSSFKYLAGGHVYSAAPADRAASVAAIAYGTNAAALLCDR